MEHVVHLDDRRHIPVGQVAIEGCRILEHMRHPRDRGGVPVLDITVEVAPSEQVGHVSHLPREDVPVVVFECVVGSVMRDAEGFIAKVASIPKHVGIDDQHIDAARHLRRADRVDIRRIVAIRACCNCSSCLLFGKAQGLGNGVLGVREYAPDIRPELRHGRDREDRDECNYYGILRRGCRTNIDNGAIFHDSILGNFDIIRGRTQGFQIRQKAGIHRKWGARSDLVRMKPRR